MPEERRPTRFQPIVPSLPRAQSSLQNRLPQIAPYLSSLSTPVANSYLNYAQQRAARGQTQQSLPETLTALQAAQTGQAQTVQTPDTSILNQLNPLNLAGGAIDDIKTITGALPRMFIPNRGNPLYEEAAGLMNLPENIGAALAEGDNLGEDIAGVLNAPGVRMIPGSYVGANLAAGTPEELLAHPLFTVLDVLPYGQAAAKGTRVFQTAKAAEDAGRTALRATPTTGLMSDTINPVHVEMRPVRPIRTALTRRLDEAGNVVPNRFGKMTLGAGDAISRTGVGRIGTNMGLGQRGRMLRRTVAGYAQGSEEVRLALQMDPETLAKLPDRELADIGLAVNDFRTKYPRFKIDETPDLAHPDPYMSGLRQRMERGDIDDLAPDERAMMDDYQSLQSRIAGYVERDNPNVVLVKPETFRFPQTQSAFAGEVLDRRSVRVVTKAEKALERAQANWVKQAGGVADARDLLFGSDDLAATYARTGADAPVPAVTATSTLRESLRTRQYANAADAQIAREYESILRSMEKAESPLDLVKHAWGARRQLDRMKNRAAFRDLTDPVLLARKELTLASRAVGSAERMGTIRKTARALQNAEARLDSATRLAIPARWYPRMFDEFDRLVMENTGHLDDATRSALETQLGERFYGGLKEIIPEKELYQWRREAQKSWLDFKAQGANPQFIHSTSVDDIARLDYPRIADRLIEPSQAKARTWDYRPTAGGPAVALTHQMKELLETKMTAELLDTIESLYGKPEKVMIQELVDRTGMSYQAAAREIQEATRGNITAHIKTRKTANAPGAKASENVRVPKELVDVLSHLHDRSALSAVFDPITKLFRTAVLPLSPRWHVYNILGGAVVSITENPSVVFAWGDAYRAMKNGPAKAGIDEFMGRNRPRASTVPRGATPTHSGASLMMPSEGMLSDPVTRTVATRKVLEGSKLGNLWDQVQQWRQTQPHQKGPFGRGVAASYTVNAWFDDFYKTATSVRAYDQAIKKGVGKEAAEQAAIEAVRKTFQNWDELLPLERQILKSVFPFYSWAKFSLGFVMRYPADHALRTAVLAQFARNELEDQGTGLPDSFRHLFQTTGMDENGNAKFLRTSGLNPFRDVTDWFTLEGMVGNVNPVISASLQAMGVNPMSGGPQLYPDLEFDPETGGLRAKTPGFLSALAGATIPQSRLLTNMFLDSANWAELVRNDPEAARHQLLGQLGLPVLMETQNIPQELMRAESNRYDTFVEARRAAVLSGDLSGLERYPGTTLIGAEDVTGLPEGSTLQAYIEQLGLMEQQGLLEPYRSDRPQPAATDLLRALGGYEQQLALAG